MVNARPDESMRARGQWRRAILY